MELCAFEAGQEVELESLDLHFPLAAVYERVRLPARDEREGMDREREA
ncbi:hypothetical protein [Ktedonosporobacter rubrisoli]|nr:hypothetical protein [Ktedonosporobacter rubrisoli]